MLTAAGVIFFIAYNWQDIGRYARFGLVEGALVVALAIVFRTGVDRLAGQAALLACALLAGALFALIGQTYQTGADTFELFATWALAILPWVILARFAPLWLLWLAIVNAAVSAYYVTFGALFGFLFSPERLTWALLVLNTGALVAWEILAARGVAWLSARWGARLLITASGACATALAMNAALGLMDASVLAVPAWIAGWSRRTGPTARASATCTRSPSACCRSSSSSPASSAASCSTTTPTPWRSCSSASSSSRCPAPAAGGCDASPRSNPHERSRSVVVRTT